MRPHTLFAFLVVLALFLCHQTSSFSANVQDYLIGPQDVLQIAVFDQADLGGKYTVEADGTFTFPLIGRIKAAGLTLRAFEGELRKRLADGFFRNPQVSVAVEQYRSQRIFVVGEVRQPGTYPLTGDMSLIEALSRAGSTAVGSSSEVVIIRPSSESPATGAVLPGQDKSAEVITVNLKDLQSGNMQNVRLRDGDTIFVPQADTVYVSGQVKNPGAYPVKRDTTVLQVLSLAGGITEYGSTSRIKILRIEDGKKKEIKVKLTDTMKAGDTIIVPERFF